MFSKLRQSFISGSSKLLCLPFKFAPFRLLRPPSTPSSMDIPNSRFPQEVVRIIQEVAESHFIALDLEFSGVASRRSVQNSGGKPSLQEYYDYVKAAAEKYQVLQVGLTIVKEDLTKGMRMDSGCLCWSHITVQSSNPSRCPQLECHSRVTQPVALFLHSGPRTGRRCLPAPPCCADRRRMLHCPALQLPSQPSTESKRTTLPSRMVLSQRW